MPPPRCFACFAGFAIAVVVGVTVGVAATGNRTIEALVKPVVRVLAPVPKIALYPAFILILGFEHASKIALVAADALFPILLATYQGTSAVEPKLVWSARAAGTSARKALFTVVLPAAPALRAHGLSHRPRHLLHRRVPGRDDHLHQRPGHLLVYAARSFHTVDMFVPLIAISMLGLLLNAGSMPCARACSSVFRRRDELIVGWVSASARNPTLSAPQSLGYGLRPNPTYTRAHCRDGAPARIIVARLTSKRPPCSPIASRGKWIDAFARCWSVAP
jgi:hypothetical protein